MESLQIVLDSSAANSCQTENVQKEVHLNEPQHSSEVNSLKRTAEKSSDLEDVSSTKKGKASWVWNHFQKLPENIILCTLCNKNTAFSSTTSMAYHLKHLHDLNDPAVQSLSTFSSKKASSTKITSCGFTQKISKREQRTITRKLTEMIAADMLPPHMVHGRGFRKFLGYICPGYIIPHRTTIVRSFLPKIYLEVKENVKKQLSSASHITYTTDLWTDDYCHNNYMTVTAHFITSAWVLDSFILTTTIVKGSATGEVIKSILASTVSDWGTTSTTRTLVTDQGSNVMAAGRIGKWHHLNCFAHKLNLCLTTSGMDKNIEINKLLIKCRKVVKFFRFKSPEVAEKQSELKELIDKVIDDDHTYAEITTEIPQTSLKADICTRWNSIYTMIESLVKNRAVVHALLRNYGKNDLMFSCKEIKALQKLLSFLEPFKKVTIRMQGDRYPTISLVWPFVCSLKQHCLSYIEAEPEIDSDGEDDACPDDDDEYDPEVVDYRTSINLSLIHI